MSDPDRGAAKASTGRRCEALLPKHPVPRPQCRHGGLQGVDVPVVPLPGHLIEACRAFDSIFRPSEPEPPPHLPCFRESCRYRRVPARYSGPSYSPTSSSSASSRSPLPFWERSPSSFSGDVSPLRAAWIEDSRWSRKWCFPAPGAPSRVAFLTKNSSPESLKMWSITLPTPRAAPGPGGGGPRRPRDEERHSQPCRLCRHDSCLRLGNRGIPRPPRGLACPGAGYSRRAGPRSETSGPSSQEAEIIESSEDAYTRRPLC